MVRVWPNSLGQGNCSTGLLEREVEGEELRGCYHFREVSLFYYHTEVTHVIEVY